MTTRPSVRRAGATLVLCRLALGAAVLLPVEAPAQGGDAAPAPAPGAARSGAALGAGDIVRITVWRRPELSGEFSVAHDGTIAHPIYRAVHVTGVPATEVERLIQNHLRTLESNPQVVVEPLIRVPVGGEVRSPSLYTVRPQTAVALAVAEAGGPTERGRRDRVIVLRDGREIVVDLTRPEGLSLPLQSGDQVLVTRRRSMFREVIVPTIGVLGSLAAIAHYAVRLSDR